MATWGRNLRKTAKCSEAPMKQTGDWGSEKSPLDPTGKQWGRNRRRPRLRRGPPCGNQATAGWRGALGSTRAAPASIRGRLAAYRGPRVMRGPPTPCMVIKGSPLGNQATRGCRRDGTQRIQRGCRRGTARGLRRPMDRFWVRHASVTHPPGGDSTIDCNARGDSEAVATKF